MAKNKPKKIRTPLKSETYFGSGKIKYSEADRSILAALSPEKKIINIHMTFVEAMKLHLAIGDCLTQLNRYWRKVPPKLQRELCLAIRIANKSPTITVHDSNARGDA